MSITTDRMNEFVSTYRLRLVDTGAEKVVPGKFGDLAEMGDEGALRLRLLAVFRSADVDRTLCNRRKAALAGGLKLKWRGEAESIFYFDPADDAQAALAIKLVGAKRRRVVNLPPERKAALVAQLQTVRAKRAA